jgi:ABC-2 type transport system ATP-binding protein
MIEVNNLTKYFGNFPAITDISFRVEPGEIVGFLGPNGAGKSTTMKVITGFLPPTEGSATVAGYDVVTESLEARRHIGYLPETVPLYTEMTVREYLDYMGKIRGMDSARIRTRIDDVVEICHLEDYFTSIIGKLSKGFRQRVGIAQAIIHEPDVLVLDEPTIGIDPIQVVETRQLIKDLAGDQTLIVSTHILPEVSQICERVIVIHEGHIVAIDEPANLAHRLLGRERVDLQVKGPQQEVIGVLTDVPGVETANRVNIQRGEIPQYRVESESGVEIGAALAQKVVESGWELHRLEAVTMSLEEIFLRLTTEEETPINGSAESAA